MTGKHAPWRLPVLSYLDLGDGTTKRAPGRRAVSPQATPQFLNENAQGFGVDVDVPVVSVLALQLSGPGHGFFPGLFSLGESSRLC